MIFNKVRQSVLIFRAKHYWKREEPLPLDLFAEMMEEGIDVTEMERNYRARLHKHEGN